MPLSLARYDGSTIRKMTGGKLLGGHSGQHVSHIWPIRMYGALQSVYWRVMDSSSSTHRPVLQPPVAARTQIISIWPFPHLPLPPLLCFFMVVPAIKTSKLEEIRKRHKVSAHILENCIQSQQLYTEPTTEVWGRCQPCKFLFPYLLERLKGKAWCKVNTNASTVGIRMLVSRTPH